MGPHKIFFGREKGRKRCLLRPASSRGPNYEEPIHCLFSQPGFGASAQPSGDADRVGFFSAVRCGRRLGGMGHKTTQPRKSLDVPHQAPLLDLSPLDWTALAIAGKQAKRRRSLLEPGMAQPIDLIVHLSGHVDVAGDQTGSVKTAPEAEEVLTIVFAHLGPGTRQKVFDALVADFPKRESIAFPEEATHLAETAVAALTVSREQPRAGNVTGQVSVERVKCGKCR
jgi:hypothetical protein